MPEGDTIYRAARTLNLALAGQTVTSFESALPQLSRVEVDQGVVGRTVEKVASAREVAAHVLFRRPHSSLAHAHEWQLAHLPARRNMAAPAVRYARRNWHTQNFGGGL